MDLVLSDRALKRIHVHGPKLRAAKQAHKEGQQSAPYLIVKHKGKTYHCRQVEFLGTKDGEGFEGLVSSLDGMPSCRDAVAWVEMRSPIRLLGVEER